MVDEDKNRETYNVKVYQTIEAKPRNISKWQADDVAVYIKTGIDYDLVNYNTNIVCLPNQMNYQEEEAKVFCVLYRLELYRLTDLLPHFEKPAMLHEEL